MKRSGTTLVFVIVWAAVLFGAFVVGVCIKEVRFHYAKVESKADTEPKVSSEVQKPSEADELVKELAEKSPMPGPERAERPGNFSPEEMPGFGEGRGNMRERLENMSEEEREQFRSQMRERFGGRRREGGMRGRFENMSEEERARMEEERRQMRERFENMSEEEREAFRAQMRERFGGRRPQGDGQSGRRRPGGRSDAERQEND
jgi:hypothetical protein